MGHESARAGRWDDVYGLATSEKVPPSESVSDGSCTTQFMFDPAATCMGIWIFANADATASRPKWGRRRRGVPGICLPADLVVRKIQFLGRLLFRGSAGST